MTRHAATPLRHRLQRLTAPQSPSQTSPAHEPLPDASLPDALLSDATVMHDATVLTDATVLADGTALRSPTPAPASDTTAAPQCSAQCSTADTTWAVQTLTALEAAIQRTVLGKQHAIRLCLAALAAGGHVLIEDVPGTGKTRLARALAQAAAVPCSRIQGTPDLLPADVTGGMVFDQRNGSFSFRKGPVFASIVLVDEINRASPRAQAALLEVMEEHTVTADGISHAVPDPFLLIATQNPHGHAGTSPLPDAELDRFLLQVSLGHPGHATAVQLITTDTATPENRTTLTSGTSDTGQEPGHNTAEPVSPVASATDLQRLCNIAGSVYLDRTIAEYIVRIVEATRREPQLAAGASMRAALALARCTRAWALFHMRDYVIPDDVRELTVPVLAHRLHCTDEAQFQHITPAAVLERLLGEVPAPTGEEPS